MHVEEYRDYIHKHISYFILALPGATQEGDIDILQHRAAGEESTYARKIERHSDTAAERQWIRRNLSKEWTGSGFEGVKADIPVMNVKVPKEGVKGCAAVRVKQGRR